MNPQSENFEQIRKLLALKRHEQPPPGYFETLSARIVSRIESETAAPMWWQRLGFALGFKPAFVCAMGVLVCGLFCIGILSTLQGTTATAIAAAPQLAFDAEAPLPMMSGPEENRSSIDPVVHRASAFDHAPARAERISYTSPR